MADGFGNVFVAGATQAPDFPVTGDALDTAFSGDGTTSDAFVMKLDPSAAVTGASSGQGGGADSTL